MALLIPVLLSVPIHSRILYHPGQRKVFCFPMAFNESPENTVIFHYLQMIGSRTAPPSLYPPTPNPPIPKSRVLKSLILNSIVFAVDWNKNAQHESCELSFIGSKMRTIAWETAFHIALRNCSKEVAGKVSIYVILVKGEYMQSNTYFL